MTETPLVSVIVPTRNRPAAIMLCLEALAAQTYAKMEIIVVDDCSDDDTPERLAAFRPTAEGHSYHWFRNDPQAGANPSRNRGVRESQGDFIAFLDDDCIARPDWLARLMAGFDSERVAAVTGGIEDPKPRNLYELTLRGTHRVHGDVHATRLIAGNMCIRRDLLLRYALDEDRAGPSRDVSVSGRGDEEGLFLILRAAGYEQHVQHDAIVLHDHHHHRRTFFRQAFNGGKSTAKLGHKYGLPPRVELMPLLCGWLLAPLGAFGLWFWLPSIGCFGLFLAAILYNDLFRKRKSPAQVLMTFPLLVAYYHARLAGYVVQHARLLTGREQIERVDLSRFSEASR